MFLFTTYFTNFLFLMSQYNNTDAFLCELHKNFIEKYDENDTFIDSLNIDNFYNFMLVTVTFNTKYPIEQEDSDLQYLYWFLKSLLDFDENPITHLYFKSAIEREDPIFIDIGDFMSEYESEFGIALDCDFEDKNINLVSNSLAFYSEDSSYFQISNTDNEFVRISDIVNGSIEIESDLVQEMVYYLNDRDYNLISCLLIRLIINVDFDEPYEELHPDTNITVDNIMKRTDVNQITKHFCCLVKQSDYDCINRDALSLLFSICDFGESFIIKHKIWKPRINDTTPINYRKIFME